MYQMGYADVMSEDAASAKERERLLFDRCIDMLSQAREKGASSPEGIDAGYFTMRLWTILMEDLGSAENALPKELKAAIISIGIFILKELERIRQGQSDDYDSVIDITRTIRDSL
ncbi:flagellar biosynthesis regulator FlaF [Phyllobacterium leguminum]|uniref:Flagellar protein FlaF n=1 Tax=Phyllobacterium leguminum TaxID=314237 RepID=A0A318T091_9HYPH|nr:flagellar biosynthesis regulator FlaF [Phyllobacterium leguminum]PYE87683.1 flagellar protein FlaF [Phyllobacterium leguminum]